MAPWLPNLALYYRNGAEYQPHIEQTREIIKNLIDMTTKEPEVI
jgi:hypothetical protein